MNDAVSSSRPVAVDPRNAAEVSGSATPKKRIRKSRGRGLRAKTGCLTCRKRHKKCDERTPICWNCTISNRDCAYANGGAAARPALVVTTRNELSTAAVKSSTSTASASTTITTTTRGKPDDAGTTTAAAESTSHPNALSSPRTLFPSFRDGPQQPSVAPTMPVAADGYHFAYSPDSAMGLSADLASTRWLDLLARDASLADSTFSLAPSPVPEDSASNDGCYEESQQQPQHRSVPVVAAAQQNNAPANRSGSNTLTPLTDSTAVTTAERHAWQLDHDIVLQSHEAKLFRNFCERITLWLDLFDPFRHFSTYADRLALRNQGLMKAILALAARYNAIISSNLGTSGADPSEAVQYYYETLHYVQTALQWYV